MANEKRLIDANYLMKAIRERTTGSGDNFDIIMTHLCGIVEAVPTIDAVEVVHGRWVKMNIYPIRYVCSECGNQKEFKRPYCEICGAKMDGDGNG